MDGWLAIAPAADTGNPERLRSRVVPGGCLGRSVQTFTAIVAKLNPEMRPGKRPRLHDETGEEWRAGAPGSRSAVIGKPRGKYTRLPRRDASAFVDG